MQNLVEELQQLDPNDPSAWPNGVKAAALVVLLIAIVFAGYFFNWKDQWVTLDNAVVEEETLKQTYLIKKRSAVNLDALKQQLKDIEQSLSALLKQLPDRAEMEALLVDINQVGLGRGLQFELFKPAANETINEFYAELPITIRVTGNYHDIGAFASDVSQLPRIVTLNDISLTKNSDDKLALDATAKTFRYLDEEEINNQSGVGQ
ncbi:MAG: type 4a pilus biogenesis protein PilO [Nitrosomonas sp.]|nr:type 4a pilus biogenesis protein PilO [Nitrosomonas sp.]